MLEFECMNTENLVIITARKGDSSATLFYTGDRYDEDLVADQVVQHDLYLSLLSGQSDELIQACGEYYSKDRIEGMKAWATRLMLSTGRPYIARLAPHAGLITRCYEALSDTADEHQEIVQALDHGMELALSSGSMELLGKIDSAITLHQSIYSRVVRAMETQRPAYRLVTNNTMPRDVWTAREA